MDQRDNADPTGHEAGKFCQPFFWRLVGLTEMEKKGKQKKEAIILLEIIGTFVQNFESYDSKVVFSLFVWIIESSESMVYFFDMESTKCQT